MAERLNHSVHHSLHYLAGVFSLTLPPVGGRVMPLGVESMSVGVEGLLTGV